MSEMKDFDLRGVIYAQKLSRLEKLEAFGDALVLLVVMHGLRRHALNHGFKPAFEASALRKKMTDPAGEYCWTDEVYSKAKRTLISQGLAKLCLNPTGGHPMYAVVEMEIPSVSLSSMIEEMV